MFSALAHGVCMHHAMVPCCAYSFTQWRACCTGNLSPEATRVSCLPVAWQGVCILTVERGSDWRQVTGFGYEHDEAWAANLEMFKHFTDVTQGVRRLGAAAVDLCHVALGTGPSRAAMPGGVAARSGRSAQRPATSSAAVILRVLLPEALGAAPVTCESRSAGGATAQCAGAGIVDGYWEYRLKPWDVAAGVLIAEEAGARVTTMRGEPFSVSPGLLSVCSLHKLGARPTSSR